MRNCALSFLSFRSASGGLCLPRMAKRHPDRLSAKWHALAFSLRPSAGEFRSMCWALVDYFGERPAAALLGVSVLTLRCWLSGKNGGPASAVRAVWLVHSLLLRPGEVSSAFDLVTWGRFKVVRRPVQRPNSEWSDWSV
jgi:hypothetical protein